MASLSELFARLLGLLSNYGDDIARGVTNYGDDALRAVTNYGDDAARAVANYGDDAAGHILGSNPNAIINKQPGYNVGHKTLSYSDSMSAPDGMSDIYSIRDFKEGLPIRKVHHDAYFDPEGMDFDPDFDELVQIIPTTPRKNLRAGGSGSTSLKDFMEKHYSYRYRSNDDLPF